MKLVGVWFALALGCGKGKPEQAAEQPIAKPEAVAVTAVDAAPEISIEVTGARFYEDYEAGVATADAKYRGHLVRLHGIVKDRGSTLLEIAAPHQNHINAWFTDGKDMHRAKPYDEVFIRCTGGGMLDVPILKNCVLESVVPIEPSTGNGSERIAAPKR